MVKLFWKIMVLVDTYLNHLIIENLIIKEGNPDFCQWAWNGYNSSHEEE